jgi:AcrR family transcriptional regulator
MKDKIKKSAISLFYKKGYFATSMSTIAMATGIRKSSIYHHYATKEDILLDIFRTTMNDLQNTLQLQLDRAAGAKEKIKAVIYCHIIFHVQRQKEAIIADSELRGLTARNYKEIIQMRDDYERVIQDVLNEGVAEGIFAESDTKIISYAILSMCTAVCTWFKKSGRLSKEAVADIYADFILKGLAATQAMTSDNSKEEKGGEKSRKMN